MIPHEAFTTNHAKAAQENLLRIGTPGADLQVLIVGSCRAVPYVNYMAAYNRAANRNVFHAGYVNPADLRTDTSHRPQGHLVAAEKLLSTPSVKKFLAGTEVLLCEHVENYGALNTCAQEAGVRAHLHAHTKIFTLPNWNAMGILRDDVLAVWPEEVERAGGSISAEQHLNAAMNSLGKFYRHCALSSFPEMRLAFDAVWRDERWFWTHNHVARPFTEFIFSQWLMKLGLDPLPPEALAWTRSFDLFSTPSTAVSPQDVSVLGLRWPL